MGFCEEVIFPEDHDGLRSLKGMEVFSLCELYFVPFKGVTGRSAALRKKLFLLASLMLRPDA